MLKGVAEKEYFGFLLEFPCQYTFLFFIQLDHDLNISFATEWFVDDHDMVHLHILGLTSPSLRFWAISEPFTPLLLPTLEDVEKQRWSNGENDEESPCVIAFVGRIHEMD